ncbi:MAG: thioredoxin [Hespellia sp.]|nr:thioredoxin [Hespellia sp.]
MEVKNIKQEEFEKEVLQSKIPVLVDVWAPWCGPCKMLGPVIEEVAGETDAFQVIKVNADESPEISQQYRVFSIPTLLVFKDGKEVKRSVGVISKAEIKALMN